ncbi:MAG: DUF6273 domain-containing protein, partial [Christensenellales bacterium]|nr:DUF6273 domain-containing protein [Christensenellales bacterium]
NTYEAPDSSIKKGTKYTLNDEFYLASRAEIYGKHDMDDGSVLLTFYEGTGDADRIKYRDGSAENWWLRTPIPGVAFTVRLVKSDGTAYSHAAYSSFGPAPACTIYDTGIIPNGAVRIIAKDEEFTAENKQIYTAQFGQTVYGGTVDWRKGVLTVDWAMKAFDGTEEWFTGSVNIGNRMIVRLPDFPFPVDNGAMKCSHYKKKQWATEAQSFYVGIGGDSPTTVYIFDINCQDTDTFKAYLSAQHAAGTPVQVCYQTREPVTVSLPPIRIEALDGANTVYTDSGPLSLTYNKSLEKAFEEAIARIAALEAAVLNNV